MELPGHFMFWYISPRQYSERFYWYKSPLAGGDNTHFSTQWPPKGRGQFLLLSLIWQAKWTHFYLFVFSLFSSRGQFTLDSMSLSRSCCPCLASAKQDCRYLTFPVYSSQQLRGALPSIAARPEHKPQLCHLPDVWTTASYLTSVPVSAVTRWD